MVSTNSRSLGPPVTVGTNVTLDVTYNAVFTPLEGFLVQNGLIFRERIRSVGIDPFVAPAVLGNFPAQDIPVPLAGGTVARTRTHTVTRASLQEDAGLGDNDQIKCRIDIEVLGLPATLLNQFTDDEILFG